MGTRDKIEKLLKEKNNLKDTYFKNYRDNVFSDIHDDDFFDEINNGKGSELKAKFMSLASSSALVVNTFAPFKSFIPIELLEINSYNGFYKLSFEKGFQNSLQGTNPQLDVFLEGENNCITIESKFLEPTEKHTYQINSLSDQYKKIKDSRKDTDWYNLLLYLDGNPKEYTYLDAMQLLKHLFGIHHDNQGTNVELLYLYWKPGNYERFPELETHEREIETFSKQLTDAGVKFSYYTHQELWKNWESSENEKLSGLGRMLREKYDV